MQKMKGWVLWWLLLCFVYTRCTVYTTPVTTGCRGENQGCNSMGKDKKCPGENPNCNSMGEDKKCPGENPNCNSMGEDKKCPGENPNCNSMVEDKDCPGKPSCTRSTRPGSCKAQCENPENNEFSKAKCCIEVYSTNIWDENQDDIFQSIMNLEEVLEETNVNETISISVKNIVAAIHKPKGVFNGLSINANDNEVKSDRDVPDRKVSVRLPRELDVGENNTIVFCMIHFPNETALNGSDDLYEGRLFGLSVSGKNISGLQERVNITITITTNINETQEPRCVFLDTLTKKFESNGCLTLTKRDLNEVTCSCDHLTYFGILLVSVSEETLSSADQKILSYITIIGCSISLFALVITVLIFITNKHIREDDSKKIHISLSVALILLNLHFLPSEAVPAMSSTEFCFYMALGLHYSLLATFSWMALEGLHLYLLLVKVFNIYVRRYLLKLSVVGWGVPAVIVSVVVIIDTDYYGRAPLDVSNPNGSAVCYLTDDTVKLGGTVGVFALVFVFNVIMFGVTIRWFVAARSSKQVGRSERNKAKREICTLLSVMVLLGITWGLVFFSFGPLTTPGLYTFCILNSLQGFFIFIYFVLSLKKPKDSAAKQSSETHIST